MTPFERFATEKVVGQALPLARLGLALERLGRIRGFDGVETAITLAGPPACGKNYVARLIGEFLQREVLILHMGEYAFADDIDRLVGRHGVLERWVADHPDGVVIFESVDKCDHTIQRAIAAIVADGAPDDIRRYRQCIFLFTFTLGDPAWYEKRFVDGYYKDPLLRQGKFYEALAKVAAPDEEGRAVTLFDAELLNVMSEGDLILFYALGFPELRQIAYRTTRRTLDRLDATTFRSFETPHLESLADALLLSLSPYLNAKRIAHRLPAELTDRIESLCGDAERCILSVTRKAKAQIDELVRQGTDLREFVRFERHFRLQWSRRSTADGVRLSVSAIEEVERPRAETRSPYADRLSLRASDIGFDDVAGQVRVKKEMRAILHLLQDAEGLRRFDVSLPKGLLLYGPEGVGKTMLVKAFAREAGLPYLYLRGADLFDETLVGELYARARLASPVIVVLDGVDTKGIVEGNLTPIPTGTLCDSIDRAPAEPDNFIFTVATAREREEVPEVLTRPGRIDQSVEVPELDREARRFFARKILEKPHERIDVERIVRYMSGMNGYELERIGREASLEALKRGMKKLTEEVVIDRINTIKYGHRLEKKRFKNFEEDLKKSAWHEAAHAVVSITLLPDVQIEQVTVVPRSEALGLVSYMQDAIEANMSREEIEANIAVLLSGRVATVRKYGEAKGLETGAYADLQEATLYAYSAVAQFGMDEELRDLSIETLLQNMGGTLFKEKIERRVAHWIAKGREKAQKTVEAKWRTIERIANRLLEEEVIEGEEIRAMVKKG